MKLNDKMIQAAKPAEKDYKLADGGGLFLLVRPSGVKLWRMKYRVAGKEKLLSFGEYPLVTLKDARNYANDARRLLAAGNDPGQVKKEQAAVVKKAVKPVETFSKVMDELLAAKRNRASEKHCDDYRRSMELHVLPSFGSRDIKEIGAMEIITLGKKTEDAGRYLAHRIIQRVGEVMDFAVATGRREQNPVTKMTHATIAPAVRENNPAISLDDELPDFLRDLTKYRGYPITILLMRFIMLTACRTGEARDLIWDWVDLDKKMITIPPSGYKTGKKKINSGKVDVSPHSIPLSSQVVTLLQVAQELTGNSGSKYVFPAYRNYATKASENAVSNALANIAEGKWKGRQSGHGFRRLARTAWGNHGGWSFESMEKQLAHTVGSSTVTAYDKAERLDERAKMMQWWADRIDAAGCDKVIQLKRA